MMIRLTNKECGFSDWRFNPRDEYANIFDDKIEDELRVELRNPEFLIWLSRFLGVWKLENETVTVRRRDDGWLTAGDVPLQHVLSEDSYLIRVPDGPLGPSLDPAAHSSWLRPEDWKRLGRSGYPAKLYVSLKRQRIQELSQLDRHELWVRCWDACAPKCPVSHRDLLAHKDLYEVFKLSNEGSK